MEGGVLELVELRGITLRAEAARGPFRTLATLRALRALREQLRNHIGFPGRLQSSATVRALPDGELVSVFLVRPRHLSRSDREALRELHLSSALPFLTPLRATLTWSTSLASSAEELAGRVVVVPLAELSASPTVEGGMTPAEYEVGSVTGRLLETADEIARFELGDESLVGAWTTTHRAPEALAVARELLGRQAAIATIASTNGAGLREQTLHPQALQDIVSFVQTLSETEEINAVSIETDDVEVEWEREGEERPLLPEMIVEVRRGAPARRSVQPFFDLTAAEAFKGHFGDLVDDSEPHQ